MNTSKIKITLVAFVTIIICSCSTMQSVNNLAGSKWKLTEFPNNTIPATAEASLAFDSEGNISGKSFCNGYGGTYKLKGNNKISFTRGFGTLMYCDHVGNAETRYLDIYATADNYKLEGNQLTLLRGNEKLLVFSRIN